jgi:hypothetical protein
MLSRINLSAAIIVLICFFLPWVQVSCAGARDTLSGLDLARDTHPSLWLLPVSMIVVIVLALTRALKRRTEIYPLISLVGGCLAAILMNRERLRVHDESSVISAQLTGWFWLGFLSALAVAVSAIGMLLRKSKGLQNREP